MGSNSMGSDSIELVFIYNFSIESDPIDFFGWLGHLFIGNKCIKFWE